MRPAVPIRDVRAARPRAGGAAYGKDGLRVPTRSEAGSAREWHDVMSTGLPADLRAGFTNVLARRRGHAAGDLDVIDALEASAAAKGSRVATAAAYCTFFLVATCR